jgi:hypothetical protein
VLTRGSRTYFFRTRSREDVQVLAEELERFSSACKFVNARMTKPASEIFRERV